MKSRNRYADFSWFVLAYNIGVILWGAYVRATGSGAGCGAHWPLCNGEVIPAAPAVETMIEYTHRLMSGLSLVLVLALVVWAWRTKTPRRLQRLGAGLSLFFILTEALVGAGLVLFELVAHNDSLARAWWMMVHLINTLLLVAALTLNAWWSTFDAPVALRLKGRFAWPVILGLLGMLFLGASGAITALGDTLFPAGSLAEGIQQDFSSASHFLVRLRIYHPMIAVLAWAYWVGLVTLLKRSGAAAGHPSLYGFLYAVFTAQLAVGAANVILMAPVWMQLVHLLVTDLIWIGVVLISNAVLGVVDLAPGTLDKEVDYRANQKTKLVT
ncbi:MAG: heme A synthase [Chloroflexi bacterium]|nr:COX15/CtaA family protein [Anaerolineaceae bacterium]NMB88150.1 heme A synthase [Chloroflexota bacterium]